MALELARSWSAADLGDTSEQLAAQDPDVAIALAEDGLVLRGVRTQRPTYGGKAVDLEMRFGRPQDQDADDIVVWVEAKHGASPHEHQLSNYLRDIAQLARGREGKAGAV